MRKRGSSGPSEGETSERERGRLSKGVRGTESTPGLVPLSLLLVVSSPSLLLTIGERPMVSGSRVHDRIVGRGQARMLTGREPVESVYASCKNGAGRSSGSGCAHVRENEERGERKEKDESPLKVRRRVFPHVDVHRAGSRPGDDEGGMEVYASLLISWLHPAMWEI